MSEVVRGRFCSRRVLIASALGGPPCRPVTPRHEATIGASDPSPSSGLSWSDGQHQRRKAQSALATSVISSLERSGKWAEWQTVEPRLAGFASLEEAREGWRRRDERCYQVVAGLTALGVAARGR